MKTFFMKHYKLLSSLLREMKPGTKGRTSCYFPQHFLQPRNLHHSQRTVETERILPAAL